jgi:hypothetical protein
MDRDQVRNERQCEQAREEDEPVGAHAEAERGGHGGERDEHHVRQRGVEELLDARPDVLGAHLGDLSRGVPAGGTDQCPRGPRDALAGPTVLTDTRRSDRAV